MLGYGSIAVNLVSFSQQGFKKSGMPDPFFCTVYQGDFNLSSATWRPGLLTFTCTT